MSDFVIWPSLKNSKLLVKNPLNNVARISTFYTRNNLFYNYFLYLISFLDYRAAYEFPKPSSDVKDADVPNVEAIRGGLSFRGLMKQRAGTVSLKKLIYF